MNSADATQDPVFHTVVVSTDGQPGGMRAVRKAFALGKRDRAKIIVVSVVDTSLTAAFLDRPAKERMKIERELEINAEEALNTVGKLAAASGVDCELIIRRGRPHLEILTVATQAEADLVVIGKGGGVAHADVLGGVARRVVEDADCAVLVVR